MPIPIAIMVMLFLGLLVLMLEVIIPFGISFVLGLGMIGLSVYLCFHEYGPTLGVIYLIVAGVFAALGVWWVFRSGVKWLSLSPPANPGSPPAADSAREQMPSTGDRVRVVQPLRPTGTVGWRNGRYSARTLRPEVETPIGSEVVVRGRDSIYLLVEPVESDTESELLRNV